MSLEPSPVQTYFDFVKKLISSNPLVQDSSVIRERIGSVEGFIQITVRLIKENSLDVFEYYTVAEGVTKYRYNLMNYQKETIVRWDNAPHHPELSTHPHHIHMRDKTAESQKPSLSQTLLKLAEFL